MFDRLKGPVMTVIPRVGTGVDVHAFGEEGTPLYIAGLHWPGERGLSGHSDGDVVAHAADTRHARFRGHDRSDPHCVVDVLVHQQPVDPVPDSDHVVPAYPQVPARAAPP